MRALVLTALDTAPVIQDIDRPEAAEGETLVHIKAAALNHRDVYIMRGQYPGIQVPITLGSDGVGLEEGTGRRVIINPSINWGDDPRKQGRDFSILGMPRPGTFAETLSVPTENVYAAPDHLSDAGAAALPLAGMTAWRALMTRAQLQSGEKVLITGIGGGVALFAMQFAVAAGAEVYVTSSKPEKIERAVALGAAGGALYTEDTWVDTLKGHVRRGFDVIIDSAGGAGFGGLVNLTGHGGRIAFFGGTRGKWPAILPQRLFFKQASILASTMGSPMDFAAMVKFVDEHKIEPVVDQTFALSDGAQAFERLEQGQQFGKVVLEV